MQQTSMGTRADSRNELGIAEPTMEAPRSSVAWAAIVAGAFAAASLAVILAALGSGLGFASVSPWPRGGPSIATFTVMSAIWLVIVQWLSAGLGGYLTGRLRTKWVGVHNHEVFFRDTVNGFLSWALATVVGAAVLAAAVSSLAGSAARGSAAIAAGDAHITQAGSSAGLTDPLTYLVDRLVRSDDARASTAGESEVRGEAARILVAGLRNGDVPEPDKAYLVRTVTARTGVSRADAERRVDDIIAQARDVETKARQAADSARKAGTSLSIAMALALMIGAFIASAAAALGGIHRDEWSARLAMR